MDTCKTLCLRLLIDDRKETWTITYQSKLSSIALPLVYIPLFPCPF